jgi:hypothetical protein
MTLNIAAIYLFCTGIILLGFLMLIQPFSMTVFSWGLPVMIVGGIIHIVLDHLPDRFTAGNDKELTRRSED